MDFAKIEGEVEQQMCLEIKKTWKQIMTFLGLSHPLLTLHGVAQMGNLK